MATFTLEEIKELFKSEDIIPGTEKFHEEFSRRFRPTELPGYYVETDDWTPENRVNSQ